MRLLVLFLFVFSASVSSASGYFVGNGGDGFLKDGRVILRDLQEFGLEDGGAYGIEHPCGFRSALSGFPLPVSDQFLDLLAYKLEDLTRAHGRFGAILLRSIYRYNWVFVHTDLKKVPGETEIMEPPPGSEYVQLANRWGGTIRISERLWNLMPVNDQVALVFHEMIYALLIPRQQANGTFSQSAAKAREIVGLLFSIDFVRSGRVFFNQVIKNELNVAWDEAPESESIFGGWSQQLRRAHQRDQVLAASVRIAINPRSDYGALIRQAEKICSVALSMRSQNSQDALEIESWVDLPPLRAETFDYPVLLGSQMGIRFRLREKTADENMILREDSFRFCESKLRKQIDLFINQL